ncbi:MAG TPA: hypothetical protein VH082_06940 [Rudaea sp.]|nr:hypothetical protein [Rudaea sp.]
MNVDERNIRRKLPDESETLFAAVGFADDVHVGVLLQDHAQTGSHQRVIIDDDDSNHPVFPLASVRGFDLLRAIAHSPSPHITPRGIGANGLSVSRPLKRVIAVTPVWVFFRIQDLWATADNVFAHSRKATANEARAESPPPPGLAFFGSQ